jgi:dienelactone hydrolase
MRSRARVMWIIVVGTAVALLMTTAPVGAASSGRPKSRPRIVVPTHSVQVDQRFHIAVNGVAPNALVQLDMTLDIGTNRWKSEAVFRADRRGRVELASEAPVAGDYRGVDPMGLIWSAHLDGTVVAPPDSVSWTDTVHLSASTAGHEVATADVTRYYLRPGGRSTDVRDRGLVGTLFEPPGGGRHPAVIVLGGSEGGKAVPELIAALLASHGYDALALAYFDLSGTLAGIPTSLSHIPLEYFGTAIDWLSDQPTVEPNHIAVMGASRGGELALLLGTRYPQLEAVVASAPSSVVWSATPSITQPDVTQPAWTQNGQPVPFLIPKVFDGPSPYDWYLNALTDPNANPAATIPVEQIHGPVLVINGADDQLWPSQPMTRMIMERLRSHHHPDHDVHLSEPKTGHIVAFPYEPLTGDIGPGIGGTPAGAAHGGRAAWTRTLRFLHRALA